MGYLEVVTLNVVNCDWIVSFMRVDSSPPHSQDSSLISKHLSSSVDFLVFLHTQYSSSSLQQPSQLSMFLWYFFFSVSVARALVMVVVMSLKILKITDNWGESYIQADHTNEVSEDLA